MPDDLPRVLVVGGTGVFGARLVEGLAATAVPCTIVIAGRDGRRSRDAAEALRARHPAVSVDVAVLDRDRVTAEALADSGARIVVDAAGPFQGQPPRLAEAAIAAGMDYLDLADARDFVAAFPALHERALAAGTVAVTGVSSTPALSHAALDVLVAGWRRVDAIEVGISPGNRAPRGPAVVKAILSWTGQPLRVFQDGRWQQRRGWSGTRRIDIPGLGRRPMALADVPDLDLLAARCAPRDAAIFRAGLELKLLHYGMAALAWLPRLKAVGNLDRFATPLHRLASRFERMGSDRGGMSVEAWGQNGDGQPEHARWSLVAEAGEGPHVPALPALALIRRLLADRGSLAPGAYVGAGVLSLADIEAEVARLRITTRIERQPLPAVAEALLPGDFHALAEPIRAAHSGGPVTILQGEAVVEPAAHVLGRLLARLMAMPRPGGPMPVRVTMRQLPDGSERWERDFDGQRLVSHFAAKGPGRATERFGPTTFDIAVTALGDRLEIRILSWRLGPIPMPSFLVAPCLAVEGVDAEGRFTFDVLIGFPKLGQVIRYRGWLVPQ